MTDEPTESPSSPPDSRERPMGSPAREPGSTPDDGDGAGGNPDGDPPAGLSLIVARIRRQPTLLLPFAVAGVILAGLDWLRRTDPLPMATAGSEGTIGLEYTGYPTGVPATARSLEALVDLRLPYLAWGVGLELVALLAVAVAGTVTIGRTLAVGDGWGGALAARRLGAYFGLVALFDVIGRLVSSVGDVGLVAGLAIAVPLFVAFVGFFLAPAFVVDGAGPVTALRRSARATRGNGWRLLALVLCYGLAAWLLGRVPHVGAALSTALVGSVHAVSVATIRNAD